MRTLAITLLLFFTINAWSHEKPQPQLIDEFGMQQCEEMLARIDNLTVQISNNPAATAFVILRPSASNSKMMYYHLKLIESTLKWRKIQPERFKVLQAIRGGPAGGSFWLVPPGAEEPGGEFVELSRPQPDLTRRFIFGSEGQEDFCNTFHIEDYAQLLLTNPGINGKIVIHPYSKRYRLEEAMEWLADLDKLKVPRNRIRVMYAKPSASPYTDFWIIPRPRSRKKALT